jgi:hypothetical protein
MKSMKLRSLIEGLNPKPDWTTEEKKTALALIGKYNEYGKALRREHNLMEIAQTLSEIAQSAEKFTMNEQDDWFDKATVGRNMKELARCSGDFQKLARESYVVEQRMEALYEDMGHVLNRYFKIDENVASVKAGVDQSVDDGSDPLAK